MYWAAQWRPFRPVRPFTRRLPDGVGSTVLFLIHLFYMLLCCVCLFNATCSQIHWFSQNVGFVRPFARKG